MVGEISSRHSHRGDLLLIDSGSGETEIQTELREMELK